jgi:hypothetical protein
VTLSLENRKAKIIGKWHAKDNFILLFSNIKTYYEATCYATLRIIKYLLYSI